MKLTCDAAAATPCTGQHDIVICDCMCTPSPHRETLSLQQVKSGSEIGNFIGRQVFKSRQRVATLSPNAAEAGRGASSPSRLLPPLFPITESIALQKFTPVPSRGLPPRSVDQMRTGGLVKNSLVFGLLEKRLQLPDVQQRG